MGAGAGGQGQGGMWQKGSSVQCRPRAASLAWCADFSMPHSVSTARDAAFGVAGTWPVGAGEPGCGAGSPGEGSLAGGGVPVTATTTGGLPRQRPSERRANAAFRGCRAEGARETGRGTAACRIIWG